MNTLMSPLDEAQTKLLNIVWPIFEEHRKFPIFGHVEFRMRQQGHDAAEVIGSFPSIGTPLVNGRYSAIWPVGAGAITETSPVCLTMAGLFHVKTDYAMQLIGGVLAYLRALSAAHAKIQAHLFDMPDTRVSLLAALEAEGMTSALLAPVAAVAEHEWLAINTLHRTEGDLMGRLGLLSDAKFFTIEEYLDALAAATTPQKPTTALAYRDPRALARAITAFDVTCELVVRQKLIKKPAIDRTALFVLDSASHSDLQAGISALGELMSDLQVPQLPGGQQQPVPVNRLLPFLSQALPKLNQVRVQDAIDILNAIREIRNSGVHPRPSAKLIAAHELLGMPLKVEDPAAAWNIVRAQADIAFTILQEEIYAAY